ncbi:MAG: response regulator transcription factor [Chloroflexota bacterium]|nr:response regulator transcription factor [Chloroflexota bacterium]
MPIEHKHRVLVVDDDPRIRMFVGANLRARGFEVDLAASGVEAMEQAALHPPDLVLLDLMLPDMHGTEALGDLREWTQAPVLVVSSLGSEHEKVRVLDLGADDYVTKPFGIDELLARVRANLRRSHPEDDGAPVIELGTITIDLASRQVEVEGREVRLTPMEWALLRELACHVGKVVDHRELLERVWGGEYGVETGYLRTFVKQLRKKLEPDPAHPRYILTVPGVGYQLSSPPVAAS